MFFQEKLSETELASIKEGAINQFKTGIKRINNGENPVTVGELEKAIEKFRKYQKHGEVSNEEMMQILEAKDLLISNPKVLSAIEKSFVVEFGRAIEVCEWYKEVFGFDLSNNILNQIKDRFIEDLKWTSNYKEMIKVGGFSEEFLLSSRVKEAAQKRLKSIIKEKNSEEILEFIKIFKLENLDSKKNKEVVEKKFLDLVKAEDFKEALKLKELFDLGDVKELLKSLKIIEFYDKLD